MNLASSPFSVAARGLRLAAKADTVENIELNIERHPIKREFEEEALVEVHASAVNPSDVKAAVGMMPYAIFPRTPGRDFAGVVVDGPKSLLGKNVFGSSGDLGIRRDGTHCSHVLVDANGVVETPDNISANEAAGIGVPFVTAQEGFRRSGLPKVGDTVLILGLNGKVGQAAAQIASWLGARVVGVVRNSEPYAGHATALVTVIDSSREDVANRVSQITGGRGADIVFNTVGEPYYEAGVKSLAIQGRMIFIASFKQTVPFDIFGFYRGRHVYVGIDTLSLSSTATANVLRDLVPGFASGKLKPFTIKSHAIFSFERAKEAYAAVLASSRDRIIFTPNG